MNFEGRILFTFSEFSLSDKIIVLTFQTRYHFFLIIYESFKREIINLSLINQN
jgi:hypothetical protein